MKQRKVFEQDGTVFGRGLGFFDAIYGFAITLLIANVDMPPAQAWSSLSTLLDHGLADQLLGFFVSFVVIAVFWRHNADLLGDFRGMDGVIITMNLAAAALIVLLPFTTQGISDPGVSDYPLATALYAINITLLILSQMALMEVGRARGLLEEQSTPAVRRAIRIDLGAQAGVFLLSIPVAYLIAPEVARLSWLVVLPVVATLTGRWSARVADASTTGTALP